MLALVITADDLGIDPARDAGVFEAFERDAVTQASLLVTGPSATAAADRARRNRCPLGLHLNLTEGAPCARPDEVRSLLDRDGNKLGKHGLREAAARAAIDAAHVAREARAQIARFEQLTGHRPRHSDGHQHAHVVPGLVEVLARVFAEAGVETTRIPEQRVVASNDDTVQRFSERVSREATAARPVYAGLGIFSTDAFAGLDLVGSTSATTLHEAIVATSWARTVELMCHPGHAGIGWDDFNRSPDRQRELDLLLAAPFASLVAERRVAFSTFTALSAEGRLGCSM